MSGPDGGGTCGRNQARAGRRRSRHGETYYLHWLNTLEKLVADKGVTTQDALHRYRHAWEHACDRTPHGQPIELREEDFR
jgi:hypothetical protein